MKKTNRFIALLTALVLVFSTMISSVAFAAVPTDVAGTDFEVAVGKLKAVGVMEGYPDGTFLPNGEITRAEFAKIAVMAYGLGDAAEASKGTTKFTDVAATNWAAGYINLAANRGLITGYPDGTYKPEGKLTNAEAITILCRLLGLGPVIDKEGTWPANYVGRASNEGILKDVNVASTTKATRGLVAKMLVNTLTIQTWGASGYKNDGSVEYGPLVVIENGVTRAQTLLQDKLEVTQVKEERVEGYDVEDNELDFDNLGTKEIADGVDIDLYEAYLNEATVWVNDDDEVIFLDITSKYFVDAIEINDDNDEVTLVGADKTYDLDLVEDYINDSAAGNLAAEDTYPLAKVVLNDKNDVVYIDAYSFDEFLVVKSVKDDVITSVDDEEFDFEDYTIFKDGKLIDVAGMVKDDIVVFDATTEFAEVYNKTVKGGITDIFDGAVEVAKVEYDFAGSDISVLYYVDEDDNFVPFDEDAAEQMQDEDQDVTVFLDRAGEALFITGSLGEKSTNAVGGVLVYNGEFDVSFGKTYIEFTFINQEGKKVTKTIKAEDLEKIDGVDVEDDTFTLLDADPDAAGPLDVGDIQGSGGTNIFASQVTADTLVEFVYDEEGNIVELNFLTDASIAPAIETDVKYVEGYKVTSDTLVFVIEGLNAGAAISADDVTVVKWNDIKDFDQINAGTVYGNSDNEAAYLVLDSDDVNLDADTTDVTGLLVSARTNTDDEVTRVTVWVDGVKKTYTVDKVDVSGLTEITAGKLNEGKVFTFEVQDDDQLVTDISDVTIAAAELDEVLTAGSVDISDRTFDTGTASGYKIVSGGVVLDRTGGADDVKVKAIRDLADLGANNKVTIILDEAGTKFVQMVIITDKDTTDGTNTAY